MVTRIVLGALAACALVLLVAELPDMVRYAKIRGM
jgi:hypothetical protein